METKEIILKASNDAKNLLKNIRLVLLREFNIYPYDSTSMCNIEIPSSLLKNAKIYGNRYDAILSKVKKQSKFLEVGTQTGNFAKYICEKTNPKELHVVDIDYSLFDDSIIDSSIITKHKGMSCDVLKEFDEDYFDYAYIDASHDYSDVLLDVNLCLRIVKNNGLIILNDYTWYSPPEMIEYGVIKAANEIIVANDFEVSYFALHQNGFFDIAFINKK